MAASSAEKVKWVKVAQGGEAGEAGAADVVNQDKNLPTGFGKMYGMLGIINYNRQTAREHATTYGLDAKQLEAALETASMNVSNANKLNTDPLFRGIIELLGGRLYTGQGGTNSGENIVSVKDAGLVNTAFETLSQTYNESQMKNPETGEPAGEQAIALQFVPPPTGSGPVGDAVNVGAGPIWTSMTNMFNNQLAAAVQELKNTSVASLWVKNTVTAQMVPSDPQTLGAPTPPPAPPSQGAGMEQQQQPGPLGAGRYESMDQLKDELIQKGASPDTYDWFMTLVGEDREDDAKEALSSFYQGLAAALCALYDMLVDAGMASPIDAEIVERIMAEHPEASPDKGKHDHKTAGLYLPPTDSGIYTDVNAKMEKMAGGSVGGAGAGYPAYFMAGPSDHRMCPKIKKPVSTFICRYHCLDGLNVDDHQVLCGQAIWLESMIDKYSREYRDKDGKWVGGYLRKRYEIQEDDGGHPYLLQPGKRAAPLHEDAWSYEKRLQELRRSESGKRGYCDTPGDPKDLYNFDQYELMKGPKNPQLFEKRKDPIAKIADSMFDGVVKTAGDKETDDLAKQDPREFQKDDPSKKDLEDAGIKPKVKKEPWPPKNQPWGDEEEPKKPVKPWNRKKKKSEKEAPLWKKAHGLDLSPEDGGGPHEDAMMMGPKNDMGPAMKRCQCGANVENGAQVCHACGAAITPDTQNIPKPQAAMEANAIPKVEFSWNKTETRYANGVWRATLGEAKAYGDTEEQALQKLARGLADATPQPIGTQNEQLLDYRHNDEQEQMGGQTNVAVPPPMPAPAPAAPEQGTAPMEGVVPEGQTVPTTPVPEEIQGGKSEFALPGAGQANPAAMNVPPSSLLLDGEALDAAAEGDVSAGDLDQHIEHQRATNSPEEQADIENQAIAMGAHPA